MPFKPVSEPPPEDIFAPHDTVMGRFPGHPLSTTDDYKVGDTREVTIRPRVRGKPVNGDDPLPQEVGLLRHETFVEQLMPDGTWKRLPATVSDTEGGDHD